MTELLLNGLATWRLVKLVHSDQITDDLRSFVIDWTLTNGHTRTRYLLQCRSCLGIWAAFVVLALRGSRLRDLLATAAVSSVVYELLDPSAS